jgi:hypothetical protein
VLNLLTTSFVLLASACSGSSSGPGPAPSASVSPSITPSAPVPSAPSSVVAAPSPAPSVAAPALVLESDGLGVIVGGSKIRHLPFETTSAAEITRVVTTTVGSGQAQELPECGQGPRSTYAAKGFSVLLDGTRFVGWFEQGAPARTLSSVDGVHVGMTLARLKELRPHVQVTNDTLGPEFGEEPTGISGFLDGTAPRSLVTKLYAGETCFFR